MRILGFILILTLGCANLVSTSERRPFSIFINGDQTMKRRLPPTKAKGGLVNPAIFKNKAFTIWCVAGFTTFLGLYSGT